jgi:predicted GIY-YIG superfamily endonuclease
MKTFWVYMLLCRDGSFYVGVTSNVDVRVAEHEAGSERRLYVFSTAARARVRCFFFDSRGGHQRGKAAQGLVTREKGRDDSRRLE